MRGHIDSIGPTRISGWALDPSSPATPFEIRLALKDKIIATTIANLSRPDVGEAWGTSGNHGFAFNNLEIDCTTPEASKKLRLEVRHPDQDSWQVFVHAEDDELETPAENPHDLLARLQIKYMANATSRERPLEGLSVLHIGCGNGGLCNEALKTGAKQVVGIDVETNNIVKARENVPEGTFIRGDAWHLPQEKFDVIFLLKGLETEPNPRALLNSIASRLTPNGSLILECGLGSTPDREWYVVKEHDVIVRYPSRTILFEDLLDAYAWRHQGTYPQRGHGSVSRVVVHCSPKRSTALLITGPTKSGKTNLSMTLNGMGCPVLPLDGLLGNIMSHPRYNWSPVTEVVRQFPKTNLIHFGEIGEAVVKAGLAEDFAELIFQECPRDSETFAIEGEILRHDDMYRALVARLENAGIKTWVITPPRGRE